MSLRDKTILAIGCDGSRLAVVSVSAVSVYDCDDERLSQIRLDTEVSDIADVAIGGGCVAFTNWGGASDDIYYVDLKTKIATLLSEKWKTGIRDAVISEMKISSDGEVLFDKSKRRHHRGNKHRATACCNTRA